MRVRKRNTGIAQFNLKRDREGRNSGGPCADVRRGGAKGSRTPDLYNAIVALYQLSYGPKNDTDNTAKICRIPR